MGLSHQKILFSLLKIKFLIKIRSQKMGNDDLNHQSAMSSSASTSQSSSYSSIVSETPSYGSVFADSTQEWKSLALGSKFRILRRTDQVHELQTRLRDVNTSRSDFKFVADRLIRMVIEEGLNQLPYSEVEVMTPTGRAYKGLRYEKGNCGVSIVRSGEAMEKALQDCCRSMRIGKILVDSDTETHEARVIFAKFPCDIAERKVLLLYPIMNSGNKVCRAIRVVLDEGRVPEDHVILINLFSTPKAAKRIVTEFPNLTILTSEINEVAPNHFGERYFGTDRAE